MSKAVALSTEIHVQYESKSNACKRNCKTCLCACSEFRQIFFNIIMPILHHLSHLICLQCF